MMRTMYTCSNGVELLKRGYSAVVADKPTVTATVAIVINDANLTFMRLESDGNELYQIYEARGHFTLA